MSLVTVPLTLASSLSVTITDREELKLVTLDNGRIRVQLSNIGASILAIHAPDKDDNIDNIVAGFADPEQYRVNKDYFGCTIGRFANRIAYGQFALNGTTYALPVNNGNNHLHGGIQGFSHQVWTLDKTIQDEQQCGVAFTYHSADGEEGYPGALEVTVTFILDNSNKLWIQYEANTTQPTPVNLTNHTYFNLSGFTQPTILDHHLWLNATHYTPKNEHNIPDGTIESVKDSPFDFTQAKKLGTNIHELVTDQGYDQNFVITGDKNAYTKAAVLSDDSSGRVVTIYTDKPGIQVYTANSWDGSVIGTQGLSYEKHGAVALETQYFPDSPNRQNFPDCILQPGQLYSFTTIFEFSQI
ncbi:aldose epimerase family protein [Terrimonas rubra]|uniref:Aldose 1-epimerase n=1 Tax=Terrimonas rubra TaxID=1035890 RepID=A0ABW6AAE3_9BACT